VGRKIKKEKPAEQEFVRRGFDIDLMLYRRMQAAAKLSGDSTKEFLSKAINRELRARKKQSA